MSEWKPIETAPKDGTAVLAWSKEWPYPLTSVFETNCELWIGGGYFKRQWPPTHWMPLPDPPAASSAG